MRRRIINRRRKNEQGLDRGMPYRPSGIEGKVCIWRISILIKHCCYSVKGDAQAVTYVAACAIVSVFREKS